MKSHWFTLGAVAAFAGSVIAAVRVSPAAALALEADRAEREREMKKETTIQKVVSDTRSMAPYFAPTTALFLTGLGLLAAGYVAQERKYAALGAILSLSRETTKSLRSSIDKNLTKAEADKVYGDAQKERMLKEGPPTKEQLTIGSEAGKGVLCFDPMSGRYFTIDSIETFRGIINDLNEILYSQDFVSLNELYWRLKLQPIKFGDEIGWQVEDGQIQYRLSSVLLDDKAAAVSINFDKLGIGV